MRLCQRGGEEHMAGSGLRCWHHVACGATDCSWIVDGKLAIHSVGRAPAQMTPALAYEDAESFCVPPVRILLHVPQMLYSPTEKTGHKKPRQSHYALNMSFHRCGNRALNITRSLHNRFHTYVF